MAIVASAPSLNDFQLRIVDTFRYDYGHPQLDEKIIQYAPNETPSSRFLIKMEIARLAKKCFRVIDLRDIQSDYKVFDYEGIKHFINDNTINDFLEITKKYKGYTQGAYELIQERAQKRIKHEKINPSAVEVPEAGYTSLTHFYRRKEQRLYYVSPIEIYFEHDAEHNIILDSKVSIKGSTTDISAHGMCIKTNGIQLRDDIKDIYIRFTGFEKEFSFSNPVFVAYKILSCTSKKNNYYYRIKTAEHQNTDIYDEFNAHILRFVNSQLRRHRVPIENTQEAVIVKGFEQFTVNKLDHLPVFLKTQLGTWIPNAVFLTGDNEPILQKLTDVNHQSMLTDLISNPRIQEKLHKTSVFSDYFFIAPVSAPEQYAKFLIIFLDDFINNPEAKEIARLAHARSQGNLMLFRCDGSTLHPEKQCYIASSLPENNNESQQLINNGLHDRARILASGYQKMVVLSDESQLISQLDLFSDSTPDDSIDKMAIFKFIPAKIALKTELHVVKNEIEDKRKEDRFLYKMPVTVWHAKNEKNNNLQAETIDISPGGLKIKLTSDLRMFIGDILAIDFPPLSEGQKDALIKQHYQVVTARDNVIQLKIYGNPQHHAARNAFKWFISQNLNSLTATGCRDTVYGLSRTLRNLYTHNHPQSAIFLKRYDKLRYISDIALSDSALMPEFSINTEENKALLASVIRHELVIKRINEIWAQLRAEPAFYTFYILATVKEKNNNSGYFYILKDADELFANGKYCDTFQQASMMGETRLLKFVLTAKDKIFAKYFHNELAYLTRYAPNIAHVTTEHINKIDAVGYIEDITDCVNKLLLPH